MLKDIPPNIRVLSLMKKIELLTKYYNSSYDDTFDNLHLKGDNLFSTYAKFFEKLTFLTPLIRTYACVHQGIKNVSFSKILRTY